MEKAHGNWRGLPRCASFLFAEILKLSRSKLIKSQGVKAGNLIELFWLFALGCELSDLVNPLSPCLRSLGGYHPVQDALLCGFAEA